MKINRAVNGEACQPLPPSDHFDRDDYPGSMRILFIGSAASTHSHSWITLLDGSRVNARLFSPFEYDSAPPANFAIRTYLTAREASASEPLRRYMRPEATRQPLSRADIEASFRRGREAGLMEAHRRDLVHGRRERLRAIAVHLKRMAFPTPPQLAETEPVAGAHEFPLPDLELAATSSTEALLMRVINDWKPHIVHTLGFFDAGKWFHEVYRRRELRHRLHWVLQLRGGSDLEINRHLAAARQAITEAARDADQIISDNTTNFSYLRGFGVDERRFAPIAPVPGTGGIDLPSNLSFQVKPSERRVILWPKAYHTQYALALPVLEALKLAWERLPACRIVMLWVGQKEVVEWIETLPPQLRAACDLRGHVPREEVLSLMTTARVLLAPSLVDGRPNSALEAMASGAFPIVSPLPTLLEFAREPENVLFARNLYPQEIAEALVRAMTDDDLVDRAAVNNFTLMRAIGDRAIIRQKVVHFYEELADRAAAQRDNSRVGSSVDADMCL